QNAQTGNAGSYTVTVSNALGRVSSAVAVLAVTLPPAIISQPEGEMVAPGTDFTLSVKATGTPDLDYQWRKDCIPVAGATNSVLVLKKMQYTAMGDYTVVVGNAAGIVTSAVASVAIIPPRNITGCVPAPAGKIGWWTGDGNADDFQGLHGGVMQGGTS